MIYTFVDIETSGFNRLEDSILEVSYVSLDDGDLGKIIAANTLYFYKEENRFGAENIHGLSRDFLRQYKDDYENNLKELYKVMYRAHAVGHNLDAFDAPFINKFLERNGLTDCYQQSMTDTLKIYKKEYKGSHKLADCCNYIGVNEMTLRILHKKIFKGGRGATFHSASYDTVNTILLFKEAEKRGIL